MSERAVEPCADGPRLTIVLGRCGIHHDEALRLSPGQFVPLDEPTDWPVEVYSADSLIARGELLTLDGNYCVRVSEIVADQMLTRAA
jgi:flagellar motor switch protein FliN